MISSKTKTVGTDKYQYLPNIGLKGVITLQKSSTSPFFYIIILILLPRINQKVFPKFIFLKFQWIVSSLNFLKFGVLISGIVFKFQEIFFNEWGALQGVCQNCKKRMEILHNSVSLIKIFPFLRPKLWAHWTNFGSPLLNFVSALRKFVVHVAEFCWRIVRSLWANCWKNWLTGSAFFKRCFHKIRAFP